MSVHPQQHQPRHPTTLNPSIDIMPRTAAFAPVSEAVPGLATAEHVTCDKLLIDQRVSEIAADGESVGVETETDEATIHDEVVEKAVAGSLTTEGTANDDEDEMNMAEEASIDDASANGEDYTSMSDNGVRLGNAVDHETHDTPRQLSPFDGLDLPPCIRGKLSQLSRLKFHG